MHKHQATVGNLAHETCCFKKRLRNLEQKHDTMSCCSFLCIGHSAKKKSHTSAISLCFWSRIFKTTGIPLQLVGLLLNSSSSSLSPSPRTSSCAEKMFVLVPRPKCCPWLYIEKRKTVTQLETKPLGGEERGFLTLTICLALIGWNRSWDEDSP